MFFLTFDWVGKTHILPITTVALRALHRSSLYSRSCKMSIQLKVTPPKGEERIVSLCSNEEQLKKMTVLQLEQKITRELKIDGGVRIIFGNKPLEEQSTLVSYGIRHMSTIHTVLKLPGGI